jgi:hypothetical protein
MAEAEFYSLTDCYKNPAVQQLKADLTSRHKTRQAGQTSQAYRFRQACPSGHKTFSQAGTAKTGQAGSVNLSEKTVLFTSARQLQNLKEQIIFFQTIIFKIKKQCPLIQKVKFRKSNAFGQRRQTLKCPKAETFRLKTASGLLSGILKLEPVYWLKLLQKS